MRPIDSDALIEQLMKDSPDPEGVADWIKIINEQPTIEQRPQGEWIIHQNNGIERLECPYCKSWYLHEHLTRNSYCPNCGAKMKLKSY